MAASFKNKVIVITGGSSGIGKALAQLFGASGAKVAVCGRNMEKLSALKEAIPSDHIFIDQADVSKEEDCKSFIENTVQHYGGIDILINNAGISMRALFKDMGDLKVIKQLMDINFWGAVYCTHYALPHITAAKGTIVGVSSIAGYRGLPGRTGYSASKFAMQGFLEALRTESLHSGVNVMWVCPGFTASNIRNTALNEKGRAQGDTPLEEDKLMSAEAVAIAISRAIAKRKRTLVLTSQGKLTVLLSKLLPATLDNIVYNHFKKEPGSPLK